MLNFIDGSISIFVRESIFILLYDVIECFSESVLPIED